MLTESREAMKLSQTNAKPCNCILIVATLRRQPISEIAVIPGCATSAQTRNPARYWIPGSLASLAPRNDCSRMVAMARTPRL
jgi:hypothetical protein